MRKSLLGKLFFQSAYRIASLPLILVKPMPDGFWLVFHKESEIKIAQLAFFMVFILPDDEQILVFIDESVVGKNLLVFVGGN